MTFDGLVTKDKINKGSKSEHDAVLLILSKPVLGYNSLVLRRMGGNPFQDSELDKFVMILLRL